MLRARIVACLLVLVFVLAGCLPGQKPAAQPEAPKSEPSGQTSAPAAPKAPQSLNIPFANANTIDPHVITNGMWMLPNVMEGLVYADEPGSGVLPAAAEKWDTSADKKVWTFHIRKDAKWSNGDPVTAKDFEWTFKRMLTPKEGQGIGVTLGANSYQPTLAIVGAVDFFNGTLKDWSQVGIKALDDTRLEITVAKPNPDFLLLLAHPSMLPMHPASVEQHGKDWEKPENLVVNGPFKIKEWVMNTKMVLEKNTQYWDQSKVYLDTVDVHFAAVDNPGVAYENGERDIQEIGGPDLIRFSADAKLSQELKFIPGNTVAYLAVLRSKNPVLEDVKVRQALSLAIDRGTVSKVAPGALPAPQLVPPRVPKWDQNYGTNFNIAEAKRLLAEAGYPDGKDFPEVKILAGGTSPFLEAIVDLWQKNLGIKAKLDIVEAGVYVQRRWAVQEANYVGYYWGTFSTISSWASWTALLWGPEFTQQFSLKSADWAQYQKMQADTTIPAADKPQTLSTFLRQKATPEALAFEEATNRAMVELDDNKQLQLFQDAAKIRHETHLFVPVLYLNRYFAIKPTVKGIHLHAGGRPYYLKGVSNEK